MSPVCTYIHVRICVFCVFILYLFMYNVTSMGDVIMCVNLICFETMQSCLSFFSFVKSIALMIGFQGVYVHNSGLKFDFFFFIFRAIFLLRNLSDRQIKNV